MTLEHVKQTKERYEDQLLSLDCVQGVGIADHRGAPAIAVYVDSADAKDRGAIPQALDEVPVVVEESGIFEAY